jgi:hypothetical protein
MAGEERNLNDPLPDDPMKSPDRNVNQQPDEEQKPAEEKKPTTPPPPQPKPAPSPVQPMTSSDWRT